MSSETSEQCVAWTDDEPENEAIATSMDVHLLDIWSRVLNMPKEKIPLHRSFLSLGGDSITAMQVVARCRAEGIVLTVPDIMRSKSLARLALCAQPLQSSSYSQEETFNVPFNLSPIQQMYSGFGDMVMSKSDLNHFNQSFLLRLSCIQDALTIGRAIRAVVRQHSMLRARFKSTEPGVWVQLVTTDVDQSYRYNAHEVDGHEEIAIIMAASQLKLDIEKGPLFSADLFNLSDGGQLIFLIAHHLVIDLFSWRVILHDLEEVLKLGTLTSDKPFPFPAWSALQAEFSQENLQPAKVLPPGMDIVPSDLGYWGMADTDNLYGDVVQAAFTLDDRTTSMLQDYNDNLGTKFTEILLAGVFQSFRRTFTDRSTPTVFSEYHGREPWDSQIDLSNTVGWFTTIAPIHVPVEEKQDIIQTLRQTRDLHRSLPSNGWAYMASRFLNDEGIKTLGAHSTVEILFNYLGRYQQLERQDSLFRVEPRIGGIATSDIGPMVPRFSVLEMAAVISDGCLQVSCLFSKKMSSETPGRGRLHSLTDFPLLSLRYEDLDNLTTSWLPKLGVSDINAIEDIYPCSLMQQGMLLGQTKTAGSYDVQFNFEVFGGKSHSPIDVDGLLKAWQTVVAQHGMLRTVFLKSQLYQVVLNSVEAKTLRITCDNEEDITDVLDSQVPVDLQNNEPPHRLIVCELKSGRIVCRLEISHLIMDALSISIIVRDLGLAYEHKSLESSTALYSDYMKYLQDRPLNLAMPYWKTYLANLEPTYFPRLDDCLNGPNELHTACSTVPIQELDRLSKDIEVTLANILQTALAIVLRAYTGNSDVCFGYITSGRDVPVPEVERIVGPFINILVSRLTIDGASSLKHLAQTVQADNLHSISNQHVPLIEIQHMMELRGQPLFNTVMSFQSDLSDRDGKDHAEDDQAAVSFKSLGSRDPTEFDITFNVAASRSNLKISLGYWTSKLSDKHATNLLDVFNKAIQCLVTQADHPANSIDLVSSDSREMMVARNQAAIPVHVDDCMHKVIHRQTMVRPEAPAVCAWDASLTYKELDELSGRLAAYLVTIGVGVESIVPVCFEKSAFAVLAMLGVLKAGGAFVPLDYGHPVSRLQEIVSQTGAHVVIVSPNAPSLLAGSVENEVRLSAELINSLGPDEFVELAVGPFNLAYVVFTSGSSGKPKGVLMEHSSVCSSMAAHGKVLNIGQESRVLQFASFMFDATITEIFTTLTHGGCVCIPSETDRVNDIVKVINEMDVNWALFTPSFISLINPESIPSLKVLVLGGEALRKDNVATWAGQVQLFNAYGPAESCVICAAQAIDSPGIPPNVIGKAVGSVCWVTNPDDHNILTPIGCIGELLIEGPGLARGYLDDHEQTERSFIIDPEWLGTKTGRRFYKSGDLVQYNSDGTLNFIARKDSQVKLRGQRIELGEIEYQILREMPSGTQVMVDILGPPSRPNPTLIAFVSSPGIDAPDNDNDSQSGLILPMVDSTRAMALTLDGRLCRLLPSYMVPSIYIPVTSLPTNSAGKLHRARLLQLASTLDNEQWQSYSLTNGAKRPPSTEMEMSLHCLWVTVLNIESASVGIDDNFFRLGGDSIGAMKLISMAREQGLDLTMNDVFKHPLLVDMATKATTIDNQPRFNIEPFSLLPAGCAASAELFTAIEMDYSITKISIQDIYPCTALQEGLLSLSAKQQGAYVAHNLFLLPSSLDIERFKRAWNTVVDSVDILRTRIIHTEQCGVAQIVLKECIDWQTSNDLDLYLDTVRAEEFAYGTPLTRYCIVQSANGDQHLVWTAHHAVYDGWSIALILGMVERVYEKGFMEISPPPFTGFIRHLSEVSGDASEAFWKSELDGVTASTFFHSSLSSSKTPSNCKLEHSINISRKLSSTITMSTIIRAAWAVVVARYLDSPDAVFGATLSGRNAPVPGIATVVGPTITTVPLRIRVDQDQDVSDFLAQIQKQAIDMMQFEHTGLQSIKRISEDAKAACEFDTILVIQPTSDNADSSNLGLKITSATGADFHTSGLLLECHMSSTSIRIEARCAGVAFSQDQLQRLVQQFANLIQRLNESTNEKVGSISICSPEDLTKLSEWNSGPVERVNDCLHDQIKHRASTQRDAPAVCAWDRDFSYRELEAMSTRLAHHLRSLGVGPEVLVPVCMKKTAWTVVAQLAVLKAGGGFVPLDPSHPLARLQEIVCRTSAEVVIVSPGTPCLLVGQVKEIVELSSSNDWLPTSCEPVDSKVTPENVAYIIFTSGSTGTPKGVVINHSTVCSSIAGHGPAMQFSSSTRALQFASYSFDASIAEVFTTLVHGGCVCIPSDTERTDDLAGSINRMKANWAFFTPLVCRLLQPEAIPTMQTIVVGGDVMRAELPGIWSSQLNFLQTYGPTECCVFSTVQQIDPEASPVNVGKGINCLTWIVDSKNHNRLAPLGCVGELLIEGPLVARGYMSSEQTKAAFVVDPLWSLTTGRGGGRRFYKTGDLVRYNDDGSVEFIGRKDSQIKLRGQRLEIGEIEHRLWEDARVQDALVILPASGLCQERLVAVLSIAGHDSPGDTTDIEDIEGRSDINVLSPSQMDLVRSKVVCVREELTNRLPHYMVPTLWFVVESVPVGVAGKLDRKKVELWVSKISPGVLERSITEDDDEDEEEITNDTIVTTMQIRLMEVWSKVLNVPQDQIPMKRSFLSLGGDSITAMQVVARCRSAGILLSVQDILRSKSLSRLALCAREMSTSSFSYTEKFDVPFPLSPIQQMYSAAGNMESNSEVRQSTQFNQSFLLRLKNNTSENQVKGAIEAIVQRHSMLRARFQRTDDGTWSQLIKDDVPGSYRYCTHGVNAGDISAITATTQKAIDIERGPVFGVDMFNIPDGQLLFVVAHHLVVDLVSWRVILQDMEEHLLSGKLSQEKPLPFQVWCSLQAEYAQSLAPKAALPFDIIPVDLAFWGMENRENLYGDVIQSSFTLGEEVSSMLLGDCNKALRTEPVELFLATLFHSFRHCFAERGFAPTIFTEGHGREPWDAEIDLSGTVGWFTTMAPIHVPVCVGDDLINIARQTKDNRRKLPSKGWAYFASRFLNQEGIEAFGDRSSMEILFNFLGRVQQLERHDSLFEAEQSEGNVDIGADVSRMALFEVSAVVTNNCLRFSFIYNRHMHHQNDISRWITGYEAALKDAATFATAQPRCTMSDFPLLKLSYDHLDELATRGLPLLGISSIEDVEDIYPCTPIQQGLLLSQKRAAGTYEVNFTFEVLPCKGTDHVDIDRFLQAWNAVVRRHAMLRTIFVTSISEGSLSHQVVLKEHEGHTLQLTCSTHDEALRALEQTQQVDLQAHVPPHQLVLCQTADKRLFCKLEMSHVIMDAASISIIVQDLSLAYENKDRLLDLHVPVYSDYVSYLQSRPLKDAAEFWKSYLRGVNPCYLPHLSDGYGGARVLKSSKVNLDFAGEVRGFCSKNEVTTATLLQTAWGLVLRCYTSSDDVCFGYISSGRDVPVEGVHQTVGPFINMLVCRLNVEDSVSLVDLVKSLQDDYVSSLPHQHFSLAEIHQTLQLGGQPLFNTMMSFQSSLSHGNTNSEQSSISFNNLGGYDPTEYDISLAVGASDDDISISLGYWSTVLSDKQASNLASVLCQTIRCLVTQGSESLANLDLFTEQNKSDILEWNSTAPEVVNECAHDVIGRQVIGQADAPALCGWDNTLSYNDLDMLSTKLARHLISIGVGPEVLVPLCFKKSVWYVVAMMGVMKAGGAFVPLDPSHPRDRLEDIICTTDARIIIMGPGITPLTVGLVEVVIELSAATHDSLPLAATSEEFRSIAITTNTAYAMFTSGSTGKPKGVLVDHRALASSMAAQRKAMRLGPQSRALQFCSHAFDVSLTEILTTLSSGGCVCIPSETQRMGDVSGFMNETQVNWAFFTPSFVGLIQPSDVPDLKTLVLGGEAMRRDNIDIWAQKVELINGYGPTEATIFSVSQVMDNELSPLAIGRGIGCRTWVVDVKDHNRLMPIGCVGELLIEGPILSKGYLNDTVQTDNAFIMDPTWAIDSIKGRRLYKTGDIVRYDSDGTINYVGRKDSQVKLRGQRLELGEIQYQLKRNMPPGSQVAVDMFSPPSRPEEAVLLAFFSTGNENKADDETTEDILLPMQDAMRSAMLDLETNLARSLPSYMIPSVYIPVRRIPISVAGKLDRNTLQRVATSLDSAQWQSYSLAGGVKRAPSTEMESTLQALWATILSMDIDVVGADDSFFRLGGDSLRAMKLVSAARAKGLELTVADIFQNPRLGAMAKVVRAAEVQEEVVLKSFDMLETEEPIDDLLGDLMDEINLTSG